MVKRKREQAGYPGGMVFTRARQQFQILYEKEGSFKRAMLAQELILWPSLTKEDGTDLRPPEYILQQWAQEMDEGLADIPNNLRRAFLARYDAYAEAAVREALIENARTAKALAIKAREGTLPAALSSQYMHANNGTSFLVKESLGKRVSESPRKIGGMKFLAPKKKAIDAPKEPTIEGEFTVIK